MITSLHQSTGADGTPAFAIRECCEALSLSRSGYYGHVAKAQRPRHQADAVLAAQIETHFAASRQTYGSRRVRHSLRRQGHCHSRRRVARLMRQQQLRARQKGRFRPRTTDSRHGGPIAPNLLQQTPAPTRPNQVWVSDVTYLETTEGWRYLSATLDLCTRKVLAWTVADTLATTLCTSTLQQALEKERPHTPTLIHHSDRGVQYASHEFRHQLALSQLTPSMSRAGNCYDNAAMESFWATFKSDCLPPRSRLTPTQLELLTFDYIETFYNSHRLHSSLAYQSPLDYERSLLHSPPTTKN